MQSQTQSNLATPVQLSPLHRWETEVLSDLVICPVGEPGLGPFLCCSSHSSQRPWEARNISPF